MTQVCVSYIPSAHKNKSVCRPFSLCILLGVRARDGWGKPLLRWEKTVNVICFLLFLARRAIVKPEKDQDCWDWRLNCRDDTSDRLHIWRFSYVMFTDGHICMMLNTQLHFLSILDNVQKAWMWQNVYNDANVWYSTDFTMWYTLIICLPSSWTQCQYHAL